MNIMAKLPSVTGGEAPKFYASVVNRVTKTDVIKNGNDTIGIALRCRNYKNKCGVPFRDAEMKLYYNGGFDSDEEYIDFLVNFGLIEQKGAYFKSEKWDFSLQGRAKLLEWLHEHEDVYTKLKEEVDELLTKEGVLDANNVAEEEDIDFKSLNNHSSAVDNIVDEIIEEQSVYETTT
jgi:recombination protein RecA